MAAAPAASDLKIELANELVELRSNFLKERTTELPESFQCEGQRDRVLPAIIDDQKMGFGAIYRTRVAWLQPCRRRQSRGSRDELLLYRLEI